MPDHQESAAARRGVRHPRAFRRRERHRLFAQAVYSLFQRLDRSVTVQIGGKDDIHEIERFRPEHLIIIGIVPVVVVMRGYSGAGKIHLRRAAAGKLVRLHVADGDDADVLVFCGELFVYRQMVRSHAPDAAQSNFYHDNGSYFRCAKASSFRR